jgi:YD repeat-containing protein
MRISLIIFLGLFSSSMSFAQQLPFPTPTPTNQSMSPQTSSKGVSANFFIAKATLNAALDPTSCTTSGVGIVNTPGASYSFPDVGAPGTYWGQYSGGYFTNNCLNVVPGDPLANVDGCNFTFLCLVRVEPGPGIVEFNSLQYSYSNGYSPNSMPPSWFTIPTSPAGDPPSLWSFAPNSIVISSDGDTISSADGVPFTIDGYPLTTATSYCATCGDPVSLATGAFWHEMTDFSVKGRTAATTLALKRTYISQPLIPFGDFGANWFSSYETKILAVNPTANTNLVWIDENGGAWTFTRNSDNSFSSPPAFFGKLVEFSDHWEIQKTHGIINSYTRSAGVAPVGSLIQISEPHGEKITFAYNSNGKLTSAYTPLAGEVDFARDSSGRVTTVTRVRDSLSYSYAYDSSGELISSTDFNYQTTYYGYYRPSALVGSLLTYIFDPIGRLYQQSFDSIGRVIFQTEPGGASRTFTYTSQFKNPTTVVNDIDGSTTTYGFDSYYHTVSENHSSDNSTRSYAWSNQNQLTSITDELGFITQYGYDSRGNLTSIQKPEDKKPLSFSYDQKFDVVNAITPLTGTLLQLTINQSNGDTNLVTRGNLSLSYSYDSFGNKLVTNNGLASYADQRNSNGLLTYVYDAHNPATLSYDSRGRVISIFSKSGRVIKITYNDYDKITSINDSAGSITNFLYDPVNRVIEKQVADGKTTQTTSYTWDARDRLTKVTDPLQNTNQIQYDYIDPNSNLKYITSGPTSIVDAANNTTKFQYDARDRLIEKVDASGGASKFSYNLRGDQVSITDQDSNVTTFSFDGNSRISQRIRPSVVTDAKGNSSKATQVTNFTYDPAGHILKEQNLSVSSIDKGKAFVTEYTYDSQDRLAEKKLSTQMNSVLISVDDDSTYSYQPQLDKIRLTSANNQLEQLTFSYEVTPPFLNAKYGVKATDPKNSLGLLQGNYSISRDVTGNIAALTDANGHELFSEISDSAGRLLELTSGNYFGKQSKPFSAQIGYDGYGRKVNIAFSSGLQGTTTFDVLNRPTSIIWNQNKAQQFTESLQYDAVGNMITEDRETGSISMKYDVNHQLTAVTGGLSEKSSNAGIVGLVEAFLGKTA